MKRTKVLALILLYSILTAAMLQGFKMITTLWTVAVIQETLQMCPKPKALFTENYLVEQEHLDNIRLALSISA